MSRKRLEVAKMQVTNTKPFVTGVRLARPKPGEAPEWFIREFGNETPMGKRETILAELRARISSGDYLVGGQDIADAILRRAMQS